MHSRTLVPCLVIALCIAAFGNLATVVYAQKPSDEQADKWNVGKIVKETKGTPVWTDAKLAAAEFSGFEFVGEYRMGQRALQVVPAEGRFYLSFYHGGLPGTGWDGSEIEHQWLDADSLKKKLTAWKKVDRSSQLEFSAPPVGATVLFDGKKKDNWSFGQVIDGLLQAGAKTRDEFADFKLHVEFMTPLKPTLPLSHPGRGNSGVFALGAYEVQVVDTFALDPSPEAWLKKPILKKPDTWCGSIYGIRPPAVNVCLPPLTWQTLDIEFNAASFDGDRKTSDAVMSVHLNGVLVQDSVRMPSGTGGGPSGPRVEVARGPILIQKHGSPVLYRNIWILNSRE